MRSSNKQNLEKIQDYVFNLATLLSYVEFQDQIYDFYDIVKTLLACQWGHQTNKILKKFFNVCNKLVYSKIQLSNVLF
jgi:hypothetical protein